MTFLARTLSGGSKSNSYVLNVGSRSIGSGVTTTDWGWIGNGYAGTLTPKTILGYPSLTIIDWYDTTTNSIPTTAPSSAWAGYMRISGFSSQPAANFWKASINRYPNISGPQQKIIYSSQGTFSYSSGTATWAFPTGTNFSIYDLNGGSTFVTKYMTLIL